MSKLNKIFNSIPVEIPERSGFDLSHQSIGTATTGTVVPVTHFEVLPGDKISMGSLMRVTLPPFAVPFMGRIDAELTAAFIPYRLLWKGWQNFITQNAGSQFLSGSVPDSQRFNYISKNTPFIEHPNAGGGMTPTMIVNELKMYGPGTLSDYLGVKPGVVLDEGGSPIASIPFVRGISAMPFLAYHKFCDDWIRDENNMRPFFAKKGMSHYNAYMTAITSRGVKCRNTPSEPLSFDVTNASSGLVLQPLNVVPDVDLTGGQFDDIDKTLGLGSLRQRCWAKDYFTTATTRPQAGADASVAFSVQASGDGTVQVGTGSFTIASLRQANALQKWAERNNIAGTDYGSQILAHFGVTPPDAVLDRSVLLGSFRTPVIVNSVENNSNAEASSTKNPFGNQVGSAAGFGSAVESGRLVDDFEPHEHGIIMVFFTLIPHAYYNSGVDRQMLHTAFGDFAWPEFAGIGDQAISDAELSPNGSSATTFGYNQRYSEYKFKLDRISGFLEDGFTFDRESGTSPSPNLLSVYALQRGFDEAPVLGSDFLEIPKDYLDQVFNVESVNTGFSCMFDCYFDCSALRVLPEYSLPHL